MWIQLGDYSQKKLTGIFAESFFLSAFLPLFYYGAHIGYKKFTCLFFFNLERENKVHAWHFVSGCSHN